MPALSPSPPQTRTARAVPMSPARLGFFVTTRHARSMRAAATAAGGGGGGSRHFVSLFGRQGPHRVVSDALDWAAVADELDALENRSA
jgi:hypothetical protein